MIDREKRVRTSYEKLTKLLIQKNITITTMESATSGQIASLITDTEGASAIMKGAYVTYSNEAKIKNGVRKETLDTYTVYSRETAIDMASACRKSYAADIGIGVTGTMGNIDPANPEASVPGNVYFAVDFRENIMDYHVLIEPQVSRFMYKMVVAEEIVNVLLRLLEG